MINDTPTYINQYYDVTDLPETAINEKLNTCNVSCIGMICMMSADVVLHAMYEKYGYNNKFQEEEVIVKFLNDYGHECKPLLKSAWPDSAFITERELFILRAELDKGNVVLYHKYGHYQLLIGYEENGEDFDYIFNDPAGDRKLAYNYRERESGHAVRYSDEMVKNEPRYGNCYSVVL